MTSEIKSIFSKIFEDNFINLSTIPQTERPLLAHYTTLEAFEKIIKNENFLMSHPLFMNDTQEMIFGLNEGLNILEEFRNNENVLNQVGGQPNFRFINLFFDSILKHFESHYSKNVYVLCFSEYDEKNHPDGHLSMWRGYGGNGQGIALIFDLKFLKKVKDSPLFFAKVNYTTNKERKERLKNVYLEIFEIFKRESENKTELEVDAVLTQSVRRMFYFTLFFSLTSKHKGFEEEKE